MFRNILRSTSRLGGCVPRSHIPRMINKVKIQRPLIGRRYASGFKEEIVDKKFALKWLAVVSIVGTAIFIKVIRRVKDEQDKNRLNVKTTYTEEEWHEHLQKLRKKKFSFESGEEFYLFPFASHLETKVTELVSKLGGSDTVATIDLNDLIAAQLEDKTSKFGHLLQQTLDGVEEKSNTCHYKFTYVLSPGVFTQLVKDKALELRASHPKYSRFIILNYPNAIEEAVRFEQKVAQVKKLVVTGKEPNGNRIIEYFDTVDKVSKIGDMPKLEPKIISRASIASPSTTHIQVSGNSLPWGAPEPLAEAPNILKAQYKLRNMGQPIRKYGEKDKDVVERLSKLTARENGSS